MPCVYSSRMVKNYRICPIRIEIIHGRHRVVQIYTWAGALYSMAGIELCKFTHGLGLYILRFYPSLSLGVKFEYKAPAHV